MAPRAIDPAVARRRAAALAGHTGDTDAARAALADDDAGVRAVALAALDRAGALTAAELVAALGDRAPAVRRRACEVATTFGGEAGTPSTSPAVAAAVASLLDDDDATVVETAAWACGERPPMAGEVLRRLCAVATEHPDALCREAAVAALGAIGDPAALPSILAATGDKATVRRRAVIALAPFEGPEVDAALERARDDRDWQVRQAAEDLLTP